MSKKFFYSLVAFVMLAANFAGPIQVFADELADNHGEVVETPASSETSDPTNTNPTENTNETQTITEAPEMANPQPTNTPESEAEDAADLPAVEPETSAPAVAGMLLATPQALDTENITTFEELLQAFDLTWGSESGEMVIKLNADIAQTYGTGDYLAVNEGWKVTLDLNGHTLTLRNDGPRGLQNHGTLVITGNGILTNSADNQMNEAYGLVDNYGGTMVIENGTYIDYGQGGGAAIKNRNGTITINAATITGYGTAGGNACVYNEGTLNIADGVEMFNYSTDEYHNGYFGAYALISGSGTMTVGTTVGGSNQVKVTGNRGAIAVNGGTAVINNGIYIGNTYYGAWITNNNNVTDVTINYAEMTGTMYGLYSAVDDGKQDVSDATIAIKDGKYRGNAASAVAVNASGSAHSFGMEITGGWYATEPDESYILDGYTVYDNIDNGYVVAPIFQELNTQYTMNLSSYEHIYIGDWLSDLPEGMSYVVEDTNIAQVAEKEYTYYNENDEKVTESYLALNALAVGQTKIKAVYNGYTLDEAPVIVYDVSTDLKNTQAVGTSQTFTMTPSEGVTILGVHMYSGGEEGDVTLTANEDGTYTLTVNKMPFYTSEDGEVQAEPYIEVLVATALNLDGESSPAIILINMYPVLIYDSAAEDQAGKATGESTAEVSNENIMQGYVSDIIGKVFEQLMGNIGLPQDENWSIIDLDDGTTVIISDLRGFTEALMNGEVVEAVLTEPNEMDESILDSEMTSAMRSEMGVGKTGHRFVNIDVELRAGGRVVGFITELGSPLTVTVDVSADSAPAAGYTRTYYVVRYHNGVAERIDGVEYDPATGVIKFASDKFSTYLIAYEDVLSATADTGEYTAESSSAAASSSAVIATVLAAIVVLVVVRAVKMAASSK